MCLSPSRSDSPSNRQPPPNRPVYNLVTRLQLQHQFIQDLVDGAFERLDEMRAVHQDIERQLNAVVRQQATFLRLAQRLGEDEIPAAESESDNDDRGILVAIPPRPRPEEGENYINIYELKNFQNIKKLIMT